MVHAVASTLFVEELAGRWEAIRELQPRIERSVAANVATPCVLNASLLLSCAVACAERGDADEARRLERAEQELGMAGYQLFLDPLRARLALIRGDLEQQEGLLEKMDLWYWATHGHLLGCDDPPGRPPRTRAHGRGLFFAHVAQTVGFGLRKSKLLYLSKGVD